MSSTDSLNNLLTVLGQTMIIVLIGILSRKFNWLPKDTSSLSIVVGKMALPAIFFSFAASMDLGNYNFAPIAAILITRVIMILLCGFVSWIARFEPFFSCWGILGIFVTQSNDFAIGIPIINALWDNDKTHFGDYAVIYATLALLTSSICIAFILIGETSKTKQAQKENLKKLSLQISEDSLKSKEKSCIHDKDCGNLEEIHEHEISDENSLDSFKTENNCTRVITNLLKNQLILAVVLGGVVNAICRGMGKTGLPPFFSGLLSQISSPFNFLALLLMGIGMAGKITISTFFGRQALFPITLVVLKMIVYPILARGILTALYSSSGLDKDEFDDFQNFEFLYGALPPAITPVVLAQSFNVMPEMIINAMMISLLFCAPYIFLTSLIFGMNVGTQDTLPRSVDTLSDAMNVLSIFTGIILLTACIFHKPWRRFPMSLICGLVFCQIMYSLCKLPCQFHQHTHTDTLRYVYAGNCFFRYASHMAFIVLSILNALYRTKPRLIYNHVGLWKILSPIIVIIAGAVGVLLPVFSHGMPDWVSDYHTYCWLWYQPQFDFAIVGSIVCSVIIIYTLSVSMYYRVVSAREVNKLNETVKLHKFIVSRASTSNLMAADVIKPDDDDEEENDKMSSLLGANVAYNNAANDSLNASLLSDVNGNAAESDLMTVGRKQRRSTGLHSSIVEVPAADFNAFHKQELNIDFCFRLQSLIIVELLRLLLGLVFLVYIINDEDLHPDQSFYELQLIATFVIDSQAFITFLAFCVSEPFYGFIKSILHIITCNAFKKSNALAEVVGPTKYVFQ